MTKTTKPPWAMDAFAVEARAAGEPPPDLQFSYPDCTVCDDGGAMDYDESWCCRTCGTTWSRNGAEGEWDSDVLADLAPIADEQPAAP